MPLCWPLNCSWRSYIWHISAFLRWTSTKSLQLVFFPSNLNVATFSRETQDTLIFINSSLLTKTTKTPKTPGYMNRFFSTRLGLPYSLTILQFCFKTPLLTLWCVGREALRDSCFWHQVLGTQQVYLTLRTELGREFALGSMLSNQDEGVVSELSEDKNLFRTKRQKAGSLWIFGMNTDHESEPS